MAYAITGDAHQLWYESQGEGEAVVFVHEFGGDYRSWDGQFNALSARFFCVRYSARGFHPSDIPDSPGAYGQPYSTRDLLDLINHLDLTSAHVVGTSMGSFTSLDFALHHPERVLSLTLVGNSSVPRDDTERELDHLFAKIALLAVSPPGDHLAGVVRHRRSVGGRTWSR